MGNFETWPLTKLFRAAWSKKIIKSSQWISHLSRESSSFHYLRRENDVSKIIDQNEVSAGRENQESYDELKEV